MISKLGEIFVIIIVCIMLVQPSSITAQSLDSTKIGVVQGQEYQGYVVLVYANQSGNVIIFGQNVNDIKIGDPTEVISITKLDNSTGDISFHHSDYSGLSGWDEDANLMQFCGRAVYNDWAYWRDSQKNLANDPQLGIQLYETDQYYLYITQGNGTETNNGVTTPTHHRQDCIYNKQTGFQEFFGLYEEWYYPDHTEVLYQAQQFLLTTEDRRTNDTIYLNLLNQVEPTLVPVIPPRPTRPTPYIPPSNILSSDVKITETTTSDSSNSNSTPNLALNYPFQMSLFLIILLPIIRKFRSHKKKG